MHDVRVMRVSAIVPAYQAEPTIAKVVRGLLARWPQPEAVFVIDDGSTDQTQACAKEAGATVIAHAVNQGKGAALRTGLRAAAARGYDVAVSVDADGQHPPSEAWRLHQCCQDPNAIVVGVRDLLAAGAPRSNQLSNAFSNQVLSAFTGRRLEDTQCGLRRYPIAATLALDGKATGYAYEAEILIRASAADMHIEHHAIQVLYPDAERRISHFDVVRDPARIVTRVVRTVIEEQWKRARQANNS